jgi:DNA (cytosine-5)-methyltransferase 1
MNYYNENDPKAAAWLRCLIAEGLIPAGDVDERSITEVKPNDLTGYTQQHFFAGIGGWSLALGIAGWPASRPVRTGSCPCQPFSQAGQGRGEADERHLWPVFRDLIAFGEPTVTFGEQVASKAGREWLAGIRADLEGMGYEVGAADLCAAGAGAPHIRQRLFWVANPDGGHASAKGLQRSGEYGLQPEGRGTRGLANSESERWNGGAGMQREDGRAVTQASGAAHGVEHAASHGREQRRTESSGRGVECGRGSWDQYDILPCTDGKARRVESGTFPLAHGLPGRVGLLRGYGNAIVPQIASEFIIACSEILSANTKA